MRFIHAGWLDPAQLDRQTPQHAPHSPATAVHSENPSIMVEMHVYGGSDEMASTLNQHR